MSLDERLTSIVRDASTIGAGMDNFGALPKQEQEKEILGAVEQIKAAFTDAGYTNDIYRKHFNDAFIDGIKQEAGFMTGQEWYDRFEKQQLTLLAYFLGLSGIPTIPVTDWVKGKNEAEIVACKMALESLKMARKASNLDERN